MIDLQHGDCFNLLGGVHDNSVDLIVTSPPYDNLRTYNGGIDQWSFDKFKAIVPELFRIMKKGGVIVWNVADATIHGSETGTSFRQALYFMECGFNLHDTMIWEKDTSAFPCSTRYANVFEYMFVFSKGKPKTFNPIKDRKNKWVNARVHGTYRNADGSMEKRGYDTPISEYGARFNVWHISTEKNNKTGHPAVFPVQLAKDHIMTWSNEGDTVLDCFMGSGTTGVACKELDRNFIGMEIDDEYYRTAEERINDITDTPDDVGKNITDYDDPFEFFLDI